MAPRNPIRVLATYKLGKGAVQLVVAALLGVVLGLHGERAITWLHDAAATLGQHAAPHWSVRLAGALLGGLTVRRAWVVVGALLADGALGVLEGWSLRRGARWGEWLVVGTTGSPLPFEGYELWREPHVGRAVALVINAAVVAFLLRRRLGEGSGPAAADRFE